MTLIVSHPVMVATINVLTIHYTIAKKKTLLCLGSVLANLSLAVLLSHQFQCSLMCCQL